MQLVVLMLSSLIWVSGCSSTGSVSRKPDGALTLPMELFERTSDDTPRTCVVKLLQCNTEVKDGNFRFKKIRE